MAAAEVTVGQERQGPRAIAMAEARAAGKTNPNLVWQVRLSQEWTKLTNNKENEAAILAAEEAGEDHVHIRERGFVYLIDFVELKQINTRSGKALDIRLADFVDDWKPVSMPPRPQRLQALVDRLMSPEVQLPATVEQVAGVEHERLTADEVRSVFVKHVPGVESFVYRGMRGRHVLGTIVSAYFDGVPAFSGTPVHGHLLSLMRLTVHGAHDGQPVAASRLRDIAEAFMDCMAVQGRVILRVGNEISGVSLDFRGLITQLVGNQKEIALKILAVEHVRLGGVGDDRNNPTHYENRLTADLGEELGLNADDIVTARLDEHACRFAPLEGDALDSAADRCRELFDVDALLQSLVAEINSFSAEAQPESLAAQFLTWAAASLSEPHVVFSTADPHHVDVGAPLVLACLEQLFAGSVQAPAEEQQNGRSIAELFAAGSAGAEAPAEAGQGTPPKNRQPDGRRRGRRAVELRLEQRCLRWQFHG